MLQHYNERILGSHSTIPKFHIFQLAQFLCYSYGQVILFQFRRIFLGIYGMYYCCYPQQLLLDYFCYS